jgi:uncharacterized protein YqgC (DUF456 family)
MEFLPLPLSSLFAGAFLTLLGLVLLLNIVGLPANWLMLGLLALWKLAWPEAVSMDILFWGMMIGIALAGELVEMALQVLKARRYGSSSSGTFAGMIGAIVGAIWLAPLFFGLGALVGALAGAWLGCFLMESLRGRALREAMDAAFGTMLGRFLGTVCKCGAGGAMFSLAASHIWPQGAAGVPTGEPAQLVFSFFSWGIC